MMKNFIKGTLEFFTYEQATKELGERSEPLLVKRVKLRPLPQHQQGRFLDGKHIIRKVEES